ncbi:MAG TPA: sigma-54-dependent Fis family transcriptional regulator [Crocinitomix sp.]|nr:sigma-54-dependent Fis family transcriptional regulator [Crocinitomix sp.]
MTLQQVKQRFGIIGNSPVLNRALDVAIRVAPADINVLVTGESGTGKENIPKVIHQLSARKHKTYIAVNCGAIPEGTIDSELFGHEKGAFTGAHDKRKGYFEVADGGTVFLDEVAELPTSTQVRLLRVLETGEFLRVGSSKPIKTNVRVVAATNENLLQAVANGKFREDLYYRLSSVPIHLPALRERKEDIYLLFRKFAQEFSEKYRMPPIRLTKDAIELLSSYHWPGNIRQLKNITEQISIIETERLIDANNLKIYLPDMVTSSLPILHGSAINNKSFDAEMMYKLIFELKNEVDNLKQMVLTVLQNPNLSDSVKTKLLTQKIAHQNKPIIPLQENYDESSKSKDNIFYTDVKTENKNNIIQIEESLSLVDKEKELISKALEKYKGKRKYAAKELGISERTLYRKIKEYNIDK